MHIALALPTLPALPELESILDDGNLAKILARGLYAAAHGFAIGGIRRRRDYAEDYAAAVQQYLRTFTACSWFDDLERENAVEERAGHVRARRAARTRLDKLGRLMPADVHAKLVTFAVMGGECAALGSPAADLGA